MFALVLSPGVLLFVNLSFLDYIVKPVHLSFLYLQNKKRLVQGVLEDIGSREESCNGQA